MCSFIVFAVIPVFIFNLYSDRLFKLADKYLFDFIYYLNSVYFLISDNTYAGQITYTLKYTIYRFIFIGFS